MTEYVDRNLLKERFQKRLQWLKLDVHDEHSGALLDGCETDFDLIDEIPVAKNVKEIVYAHWEKADGMGYYRCSHCKTVDDKYYQPEYCPHCGAEMSEVTE